MDFFTEIDIDFDNPPPIIKLEYGDIQIKTTYLCAEHMKEYIYSDPNNPKRFYFRWQPVKQIQSGEVGTCEVCEM